MNKLLHVAAREYLETVKTRAFLLGAILMPALIVGLIFGAEAIERFTSNQARPTETIIVIDHTDALFARLTEQANAYNEENPNRKIELHAGLPEGLTDEDVEQAIVTGDYYGLLELPEQVLAGEPAALSRADSRIRMSRRIERWVNESVTAARFDQAGLPREQIMALQKPVDLTQIDLVAGEEAQTDELASIITPFAFMFLLYMGTLQISFGLLTSVIEEKNSRVVEVLLAAVNPTQVMGGKILGNVFVGLTLLAIWGGVGYFGAQSRDMGHVVSAFRLGNAAAYFLPGFLLYAAVLGAIGSACNTLKDAQSMASPISLIGILPMILWFNISQDPNSWLAIALSFIPPITPFVMILRVCSDPNIPVWQILATHALLWVSAIATIFAAGKIFRIGVLMYGKPPSIAEMVRWVRYA